MVIIPELPGPVIGHFTHGLLIAKGCSYNFTTCNFEVLLILAFTMTPISMFRFRDPTYLQFVKPYSNSPYYFEDT